MNTNFMKSFEKNWKNIKPYDVCYYYITQLKNELEKVIIKFILDNSSVLDSGCGGMPYKEIIKKKTNSYLGIDVFDSDKEDYIRINDNDYSVLGEKKFNVVFSSQVLEHIQYTQDYLKTVNSLLEKEGLLILSTHGFWEYHPTPKDYKRWTSAGLRDEIENAGFEIIYFKGVLSLPAACEQMKLLDYFRNSKSILKYVHSFFIQMRIKRYDMKYFTRKQFDSCTYIVVARKKTI